LVDLVSAEVGTGIGREGGSKGQNDFPVTCLNILEAAKIGIIFVLVN